MKKYKLIWLLSLIIVTLASFTDVTKIRSQEKSRPVKDTIKIDAETGLIIDDNLKILKANCTGCHSTKLIGQHRFTREGWVGKIRWMQQYHNLWNLGESEKVILDYLEKYYSPASAANKIPARRPPLKNIQWYKL